MSKPILLQLVLGIFVAVSSAQETPSNPQDQNAPSPDRQKIFERLVRELEDLIPTKYEEGSKQEEAVKTVVYGFMSGNQTRISESLNELMKVDPSAPPRELVLAGLAYAANNPVGGKVLLEQAAVRHPKHPGIPLAFARLALIQSRFFDALACIEKARLTNSASDLEEAIRKYYEIACLDSLTVIEIRRNELIAAERYARQWEKLDPASDKMFLASGEVRFLLEKVDDAVEFLNRRSESKKSGTPTEVIVAKWYQAKNDDANYGKWIEDAHKKHPSNPLTQLEYAAWQIRQENFSEAKSLIASYEQANGESLQTKLIKGRIAFANEDFATSEKMFTELLQAQPNNFEHVYFLVLTMLESDDENKRKQALALAQRAYQNSPNHQLSSATLGWTLHKTGNTEVALELLTQAKNMGTMLPDTAYFLASIMADTGRKAQAKIILDPIMGTRAVFVFRDRARILLRSIQSEDTLPTPGG